MSLHDKITLADKDRWRVVGILVAFSGGEINLSQLISAQGVLTAISEIISCLVPPASDSLPLPVAISVCY